MKNYKIYYWIIFILVLIMAITKGFDIGIPINSYRNGDISMLLLNLIFVIAIWILSFIVTMKKKNSIKSKWIILIGIIAISLFIPVGIHSYYAGVVGKYNKDYVGLLSFIRLVIHYL